MSDVRIQAMADLMGQIITEMSQPPLVWMEDGYYVFRDPEQEGFRYDFRADSAIEALEWVAHMAAKGWVTSAHLEVFALLALKQYRGGAA